jgi:dopamine beta-monooxygenase
MVLDIDPKTFTETDFINSVAAEMSIEAWRILIVDLIKQDAINCPNCVILDFTYNNYAVPSDRTTYVCYGFQFPQDKKYHVVRFEPLKDNLQVLHHMLLYTATTQPATGFHPCSTMPSGSAPMWGWAPGGDALNVPVNTGFPVGLGEANYAVLQMHYDNPQRLSSFRDSSGVRMYLTDTLRGSDASFLFLGMRNGPINIPPGHANWHQSGTCPSSSTSALDTPINVFASGLHMHTYGRKIWTEHFRGTTRLADIGNNQQYDFNAQQFLPKNSTILAGDNLVTHCIWDNSNGNSTITGGEDTFKEMCLNAVLYYPKKSVSRCTLLETSGCDYPC